MKCEYYRTLHQMIGGIILTFFIASFHREAEEEEDAQSDEDEMSIAEETANEGSK